MRALCLLALLSPLIACGATREPPAAPDRPTRVSAEYILTLKRGTNAAAIEKIYSEFAIEKMQPLGHERFLLRFAPDPGLERVRRIGMASGKIDAIQPNFVYRAR